MQKASMVLIISLLVSGCASTHFVDAKGRDCRRNDIVFYKWDSCKDEKESLATKKQEIKLDVIQNQY